MSAEIPKSETLSLVDGTSVMLTKTPGMGSEEWEQTKAYLAENPAAAREWESFSKDSKAMRKSLQQSIISDYYTAHAAMSGDPSYDKIMGLEKSQEFAYMFKEIERGGGMAAAEQYSKNESLMMKISNAVGGVPDGVKESLTKIQSEPLTPQEACKMGNIKALESFLASSPDVEVKDAKGITCLGYAVGANRIDVVKLLLAKKADATACDSSGGTAVHYAAAYGRKELLEMFLKGGLDVNAKNIQGQTPLLLAVKNKQKEAIEILKAKGGEM